MTLKFLTALMLASSAFALFAAVAWEFRLVIAEWLQSRRRLRDSRAIQLDRNMAHYITSHHEPIRGIVDDLEIPADFADTALRELRDQGYLA